MRKYRSLILGLVLLAMLVMPFSASARSTIEMHVSVKVWESHGWLTYPASGVSVNLYLPELYGQVVASGTTNGNGAKQLNALFYVGDHAGIWIRRASPGGAFNLTIPVRYCGTTVTTSTDNWLCWIVYDHVTGSCSYSWIPLKPSR